jgi:hypothetical protein
MFIEQPQHVQGLNHINPSSLAFKSLNTFAVVFKINLDFKIVHVCSNADPYRIIGIWVPLYCGWRQECSPFSITPPIQYQNYVYL